jgi:hypothetical protein
MTGVSHAGSWAILELCASNEVLPFFSPSLWPVSTLGEGQDCFELRASSDHCVIVGALRARETACPVIRSHLVSFPNLARRDLTGGADLGARHPAAGSPHRVGCEDGRAGQRQDPFLHLPIPLSAGVLF